MAKFRFTDRALRELQPEPGRPRIDYDDGDIRGFAIQTTPKGTKTFLLVYVAKATGQERRMVLGEFGAEPNSTVCPVCLGLPGALPRANRMAIDAAIRLGLSLGCEIRVESVFARKHFRVEFLRPLDGDSGKGATLVDSADLTGEGRDQLFVVVREGTAIIPNEAEPTVDIDR